MKIEKEYERISGGKKRCVGVAYSINRRKDPHIKSNFTLLLCNLDITITNLFQFYMIFFCDSLEN